MNSCFRGIKIPSVSRQTAYRLLVCAWFSLCGLNAQAQQSEPAAEVSKAEAPAVDQSQVSDQSKRDNQTQLDRSNIVLETTSVTGSRELPKVLVIVPWKTSEALGPGERPLASLVEEVLTPLDPDEFRREINYYTELKSASSDATDDASSTVTRDGSTPASAAKE